MKTRISITGQISGNHTLLNALLRNSDYPEYGDGMFYSKFVLFQTKKEAKKALWEAYKDLRGDLEKKDSLSYCPGTAIYYDASKAEIQ